MAYIEGYVTSAELERIVREGHDIVSQQQEDFGMTKVRVFVNANVGDFLFQPIYAVKEEQ